MYKQAAMALPSHEILSQLALDDPRAFEALRSAMIENYIARAPQKLQFRLRQLQFRVDGIRRLSRTPLGALMKIQALMWDSYFRMDQEMQSFLHDAKGAAHPPGEKINPSARPVRNARIIEFQTRVPRQAG
jgi:hypothetical protein